MPLAASIGSLSRDIFNGDLLPIETPFASDDEFSVSIGLRVIVSADSFRPPRERLMSLLLLVGVESLGAVGGIESGEGTKGYSAKSAIVKVKQSGMVVSGD